MRLFRDSALGDRLVSIHAPWEGCDDAVILSFGLIWSFNSRTLGRVRHRCALLNSGLTPCFNSRTLGRVRHMQNQLISSQVEFQFTHPGKGATRERRGQPARNYVSIHAPWEGCDSLCLVAVLPRLCVSIHAPWEGCDSVLQSCVL